MAGEKSGYIQSVDRALRILTLFLEQSSISLTEIAKAVNIQKTTAFSLVSTMQKNGFLHQPKVKGEYELGIKLFQIANMSSSRMDIVRETSKLLSPLTNLHNHNAHITLLDGIHVIYMDSIMPPDAVFVQKTIGSRSPAFSTSSGKAIMAYLPEQECELLINEYTFPSYTANTIVDANLFRKELECIRKRGYSIDNQENVEGIMGISLAIRDHTGYPRLGVSLSGLAQHFTQELMMEYHDKLKEVVTQIQRLFFTGQ